MEQTIANSTSWIGHRKSDHKVIVGGQTFMANREGLLEDIAIFSSVIGQPGEMKMTLHQFDPQQQSWGPALSAASLNVNKEHTGQWVSFKLNGLQLSKGSSYGFRLESPDTFIGIGEAAGSHQQPPLESGQEWRFTNNEQLGQSFHYFSLAFKVGLRA